MERANRASIEFSLSWVSEYARHVDRYFAEKVDFWRDIFPGTMEQNISALRAGETCRETFDSGILVPAHEDGKIFRIKGETFETNQGGQTITPRRGRFYPQGFAWSALGCYKGNFTPFRLIDIVGEAMLVDTNHPLARYPLILEAKYVEKLGAIEQHGGTCNHIAEMVTNQGPGMQIPHPDATTDFYASYPFPRINEGDDTIFYQLPRIVNHLDNAAIGQVETLYSRCLSPGMKILDLMSSWTSHLPASLSDCAVTGLGLNARELAANKRLSDTVIHDLNANSSLPFEDNEFDAVICTASIEYLIRPIEVISEAARTLKPGGVFITIFSDRWFPGKEILPWPDMHHFERLGFVFDLYRKVSAFRDLHTESIRGLPRPWDDPHIRETLTSDPIFAVWGTAKD
uniref:Methyltransferase domain-containing protein n=1 Tax=Candidatus Kentrum eta TaxID=2126337 RepID=A0A450VAY6_9GAMM|nr:MAG: Methyltransferase domain-containing protein [Candidatus Kentron sp. H]VFJ95889.1 MAG: Methyltransferase domain-containing protein [Candidatus Kentron sp. H]VFK01940.1 MAG: Methyltransferase domain-containing protein [Candidatus Kentron sp. H]